MKLAAFFKKYAQQRGIGVAQEFVRTVKKLLSVRAATRRTKSGRVVAIFPAIPGAPPRYVTGRLYKSVKLKRTPRGATVSVGAYYGAILENKNHPFWSAAKRKLGLK